jgi:hypothetical protein
MPLVSHPQPVRAAIGAIIVIGLLGALAYLFINQQDTLSNTTTEQPTTTPAPKTAVASFEGDAYTLDYPKNWEQNTLGGMLEIDTPEAKSAVLFFTKDKLATSKAEITKAKADQDGLGAFGLMFTLPYSAEVTLTSYEGITAKQTAESATQTICHGESVSSSTSNTIDQSRIISTTLAGKSAYAVGSESDCDLKNYSVYLDTGAGKMISATFTGAHTESDLTSDQKIVINSLKLK